MNSTSFLDLLAGIHRSGEGRFDVEIPADWMQGRTTYGGLTAALCFEAARDLAAQMPVRAAQVAFIGPVGGAVSVRAELLRQGKNSVFVGADLVGEQGLAARCIFCFGARRESTLAFSELDMPAGLPDPDLTASYFRAEGPRPNFTQHFNMRLVEGDRPISASTGSTVGLWLRHRDDSAPLSPTSILALADAPPPAALSMFAAPGPISSMTWMAEFLTETVDSRNGWFYARHTAQTARDGYSSQAMRLWAADGTPVLVGRQTVAIFV